jgi:hypothetical protein
VSLGVRGEKRLNTTDLKGIPRKAIFVMQCLCATARTKYSYVNVHTHTHFLRMKFINLPSYREELLRCWNFDIIFKFSPFGLNESLDVYNLFLNMTDFIYAFPICKNFRSVLVA